MEERQRDERDVLPGAAAERRLEHVVTRDGVGHHVAVRQLGPFGVARRAGRVENDGGVVAGRAAASETPPGRLHQRRRPASPADETSTMRRNPAPAAAAVAAHRADGRSGVPSKPEDRLRLAVLQVIRDLARLEEHVERHDGGAGLEDAEVRDRKPRDVRARQRDVIAGADPHRVEARGDVVAWRSARRRSTSPRPARSRPARASAAPGVRGRTRG